jgi:hypothetical protein
MTTPSASARARPSRERLALVVSVDIGLASVITGASTYAACRADLRPSARPPGAAWPILPAAGGSSGALEGKNGKIKYLKRLMYGRANFDLLRKMVLLN